MDSKRVTEFKCAVYTEHLEEASFLYEQRASLLNDPDIDWPDLEDFENRLEAHVDALVVGGDSAIEACKESAADGDFGELYTAVRGFCRQNRLDLVRQVLLNVDSQDMDRVKALRDALNFDLPQSWHAAMVRILVDEPRQGIPVLPTVLGFNRIPAAKALVQALAHCEDRFLYPVLWALGRMRDAGCKKDLLPFLKHANPVYCADAALALLRMGEPFSVNEHLHSISGQSCLMLPIGLGGHRNYLPMLLNMVDQGAATDDCTIALGLIGDISGVEPLISLMGNNAWAEAAAMALHMILGADLYEDVFIPDDPDEDELFENERGGAQDIKTSGVTVARLSRDPDQWRQWWRAHESGYRPEVCYRDGQPYSPQTLLNTMRDPKKTRMVRQMACEEMVIRYGLDIPFETDMLVAQQKAALDRYEKLIGRHKQEFRPGRWYFAGQVMS